jgi:hypothetical protein
MKLKNLISLIILFTSTFTEAEDFNWDYLKHDGLTISKAKSDILGKYGEVKKVFPDYECGFHADDQSGAPYYQLNYKFFTYIGSDKESFILEEFNFNKNKVSSLSYKGNKLSSSLNKDEFSKVFGDIAAKYFKKYPDEDSISLFSMTSDDAAIFKFVNGSLSSYSYWSPC